MWLSGVSVVSASVLRCCLEGMLSLANLGACSVPQGFTVWSCLVSLGLLSLVVRPCPSWRLAVLRRGLVLGDVLLRWWSVPAPLRWLAVLCRELAFLLGCFFSFVCVCVCVQSCVVSWVQHFVSLSPFWHY